MNKKEDNLLISPSWFVRREIDERKRTKDDVLLCGMLWLDNDGGGISDKEISLIFRNLKLLAFDTYSSTNKNRRFRLCLPLTRAVLPDEHEALIKQIFDILEYNGWNFDGKGGKKKHGFDKMGSLTTSLLYLPCIPPGKKSNYFKYYKKDRTVLDPDIWLDNPLKTDIELVLEDSDASIPDRQIISMQIEGSTSGDQNGNPDDIEVRRAIAIWNMQKGKHGVGHKAFWTLALHLAKAGMDEEGLRAILFREARTARSTKERQKEVPGIINALRDRGLFKIETPH